MYTTNFIRGNYGKTIIMNSLMNLNIFDDYNDKNMTDEDRNEIMQNHMNDLYMDFKHEIQSINSKITQNLSKYENFLHNYNRMRIVTEPGYCDGFSAYVDSNYTYLKRNNYKTDEEYKKAIINEYIIYAEEWRDNYVHKYINDINENLDHYELENIPFKKYKNRLEVLETIKKVNSNDDPDLEGYLIDCGDEFDCAYLELDIIIKPNGTLYICFDNYDEKNIKFKIMLPTNKILNRDEIFFIPPISICKKIKNDFKYIYKWLGLDETYDEIKKRVNIINHKVYQDFYKYHDFLSQGKPIYLKAKEDESYGFDIYIDNDTKLKKHKYNSDEEYKKDLNNLFNTMKNELISVGHNSYLAAYVEQEILQINYENIERK